MLVELACRSVGKDIRGALYIIDGALDRHGESGSLGAYLPCQIHPLPRSCLYRRRWHVPNQGTLLPGQMDHIEHLGRSNISGLRNNCYANP